MNFNNFILSITLFVKVFVVFGPIICFYSFHEIIAIALGDSKIKNVGTISHRATYMKSSSSQYLHHTD